MTFPKDLVFKVVTRIHRAVFDLTQGKLAGSASGMPVVKLTTVGRKSGQRQRDDADQPIGRWRHRDPGGVIWRR